MEDKESSRKSKKKNQMHYTKRRILAFRTFKNNDSRARKLE